MLLKIIENNAETLYSNANIVCKADMRKTNVSVCIENTKQTIQISMRMYDDLETCLLSNDKYIVINLDMGLVLGCAKGEVECLF